MKSLEIEVTRTNKWGEAITSNGMHIRDGKGVNIITFCKRYPRKGSEKYAGKTFAFFNTNN